MNLCYWIDLLKDTKLYRIAHHKVLVFRNVKNLLLCLVGSIKLLNQAFKMEKLYN